MKRTSLIVLFSTFFMVAATIADAATLKNVRVRYVGSGPADETFVRAHIRASAGAQLDQPAVSQDVRELLSTGRFEDVKVSVESADDGIELTYILRNRLRLGAPVAVAGAKRFQIPDIRRFLALSVDDYFDDSILAVRGHAVEAEYRKAGFAGVRLGWETEVTDPGRGVAKVTLVVDEGSRSKLIKIGFTGNKKVPTSELREAIGQDSWWKPKRWLLDQWLRDGEFSEDVLAVARETARHVCVTHGFLDARVDEPEITEIRRGVFVASMRITEGRLFKIGSIALDGVSRYPEAEIKGEIVLKPGMPVSMKAVTEAADTVRQHYTSRGYLRTGVEPVLTARKDAAGGEGILDLLLRVSEGSLVRVRNIYIKGNAVTKEDVIRRELVVYPGDTSDERQIRRSESRLRNLGYFSNVGWRFDPTAEESWNDLVFSVEEQSTGRLMLGGSFSSIDRLAGYIEVTEGNFDMFSWPPRGGGQKLRLRAQLGELSNLMELDFTEPWFMGRPLSMSLNLHVANNNYDAYNIRRKGASLTIGKPMRHFFHRMDVSYGIERTDITDVTDTNQYVLAGGSRTGEPYYFEYTNALKSAISLSFLRDTRDYSFFPSAGNRLRLSGEIAGGVLGGNTRTWSFDVSGEQYFNPWWSHVVALHGRFATIDRYGATEAVPVFDRLYAGGAGGETMVRGYGYRSIGPKAMRTLGDSGGVEYRPIGGRTALFGNVEYVVPLIEKLKLAFFADAGQVADASLSFDTASFATSVGLELRLDAMQFPIRFNYGRAVHKDDPNTETQAWGFWIGSSF